VEMIVTYLFKEPKKSIASRALIEPKWTAPPPGVVCVNVDATLFSEDQGVLSYETTMVISSPVLVSGWTASQLERWLNPLWLVVHWWWRRIMGSKRFCWFQTVCLWFSVSIPGWRIVLLWALWLAISKL
jgi:hypothetical protein